MDPASRRRPFELTREIIKGFASLGFGRALFCVFRRRALFDVCDSAADRTTKRDGEDMLRDVCFVFCLFAEDKVCAARICADVRMRC